MKLDEGRKWVGRRGGSAVRFLKTFVANVFGGLRFMWTAISVAFAVGWAAALLWQACRIGWRIGSHVPGWLP